MPQPSDETTSLVKVGAANPPATGGGTGTMAKAASAARYEPEQRPTGPPGRFWSVRRVPATVVGVVLLAGCGALLYDVVAVRAGRPAAGWRRALADELATRPLGDGWVVAGALAAMLVGAWLVVQAVTPGLRGLLPMRRVDEHLHSGVERTAAAAVLRKRAMDVPGVRSVRVRVGRRRVRARAVSHVRDPDEVRADLDAALDHGLGELGLARPPTLTVHVRRRAGRGDG